MVGVGKGGIRNYHATHKDQPVCERNIAKKTKLKLKPAKPKQNGSLLSFVTRKIQTRTSPTPKASTSSLHNSPNPTNTTHAAADRLPIVNRLEELLGRLPPSTPVASPNSATAVFAQPSLIDRPEVNGIDLWEEILNTTMKNTLGWGTEEDVRAHLRAAVITRGQWGLDSLGGFIQYFVNLRGVDATLFEGKMVLLLDELEKL